VKLVLNSRETEIVPGTSIFEAAERLGVRVPTSCHKQGRCRECLVEVASGEELLTPRTPEEEHLEPGFRLACRARAESGPGVLRCHTLRRGELRIEQQAHGLPDRGERPRLDPAVTRDGERVLLEGREIARSSGPLHGIALDLGTTTVVLRLLDLESGALVASSAFENPQRFGGSDVMARIDYDTRHRGRLLQRTLLGYLSHEIEALPVDPETIYELVVVGNATMRDLFFGLDVRSIGHKPYRSLTELELETGERTSTSLELPARRLRLPMHPRARVFGLPLVGGHVGADAAACLLAVGLPREDRLVALMDIGTNTELIVGHRGRTLAASCPAGPAFEGGRIACGMPGLDGAIEGVRLTGTGRVETRVIGGGLPEGLCGSGLVELLSELLRAGRMNARGRLTDGAQQIEVDAERGIVLRERDISELAQAKGATTAGLEIVLRELGGTADDLDVFYLAGGFGRHLDLAAAKRLGLIPEIPDARVRQVGNAAIEGATQALCSLEARRELERFVRGIRHVPLESDPDFFDRFALGCLFGPSRP
jgi:uncharacterized 2Fe-2S/4Fe-4S cluster protein (DUF4445 family)